MTPRGQPPRLWTVPPSAPFLECLVAALDAGTLVPPRSDGRDHAPADYTILLPTRRACRALTDMLAARAGGRATLLPRIRPLAEVDEVELALDTAVAAAGDPAALDVPPAVDPLVRQVLLTGMVLAWGRTIARTLVVPGRDEPVAVPVQPADAAVLAADLARLIDDFQTESRPYGDLDALVPAEHAAYWEITVAFLRIVTAEWPKVLAERGVVDPATRRDALLRAEAARLAAAPPDAPVVVAGSTGSMPASAELIAAVARLPYGAAVLPGLDTDLDAAGWAAIGDAVAPHPGHPQYALSRLLERVGAARDEVAPLCAAPAPARERFLSEAFRPAATTELWAETGGAAAADPALDGLSVVEAANEQEEALAAALVLREAVAGEGTASLVTPNRTLARRVAAELRRWNVQVDDSAGVPLADTPAGGLFRQIAETAAARLAPVPLVALLQHPLAAFGMSPVEARRAGRTLELLALRGPRPAPGCEGIARLVARDPDRRAHPAVARLTPAEREGVAALSAALTGALGNLDATAAHGGAVPLGDVVAAHVEAYRQVTAGGGATVDEALEAFFEALAAAAGSRLEVTLKEYPALLAVLMAGRPVRPRAPGHPRVAILGPLEARLLSADTVVVGGLNEGEWPADTHTDPFLNRPMRREVGLQAPERFIGLAAHDVAGLLAQPRAIVTRSLKRAGEPTVASRWLQRLAAMCGPERYRRLVDDGERYLSWARRIDRADRRAVLAEPRPRPPVRLRPDRLRVSEVETLIRDPYAVYARRILRLEPLDPVDQAPDAATRGTLVHAALGEWTSGRHHDEPLAALVRIGERVFAEIDDFPEVKAVWWPRFLRVARWFVAEEAARSHGLARRLAEVDGALRRDAGGRTVTLVARADRIDVAPDGTLRILDYKTGQPPSASQVASGLAPQLPLEALMAREGGFVGLPDGGDVAGLVYVQLTGREPAGQWCEIVPRDMSLAELIAATDAGLTRLLAGFARPDTGYAAKIRVERRSAPTAYDHLSRYAEWSATGAEAED